MRTHLGNLRSGLRRSSIFMSLTYSCDPLPPEQESESSGRYLSLLRLCPLDSCGWVLYSALEKGHMSVRRRAAREEVER